MEKKKKYCIFAAHYLPHLGGIERYVYNMSEKLVEQGQEVVIVSSKVGDLSRYEVINGIPVYRVSCYELLEGRYPIIKYDSETRKVFRILESKKFDRVIVNARFYMHSISAAIFARKNHIPCLILEHGTSHLTVHNKMWDFIGGIYEHCHTKILKWICNNFYGTCEACNEWLTHFHIKSKGTIYNAINMEEVTESLKKDGDYRSKYKIPADAMVITFTGRLLKEKGLLSLMSAVEEINQTNHKVYLFIAGKGDLDEEVQKRKSEYIIPVGQLAHEEVFRLLKESNIYCLPSVSEAFCGGVLEAVACKCYIITTEKGGTKELISGKELGTIIKQNDADTVRRAIEEVVEHWDECEKAIERAYKKLSENYTWDIIVREMRKL